MALSRSLSQNIKELLGSTTQTTLPSMKRLAFKTQFRIGIEPYIAESTVQSTRQAPGYGFSPGHKRYYQNLNYQSSYHHQYSIYAV
jgi:hypothetical protein